MQIGYCFGGGFGLEGSDVLGMTDIDWHLTLLCLVCGKDIQRLTSEKIIFLRKSILEILVLKEAMYKEHFLLLLRLGGGSHVSLVC